MITRSGHVHTILTDAAVTGQMKLLRLTGLLALIALATSRLGLLAHELLGHGGTALALGAHVSQVRLFWFAGGWIRYQLATPSTAASLAIAMGGIAVELVTGAALWLLVRRATLGGRLVRGVGAALVLHGAWYLATGAWHGYGDGVVLYHVLGDARWPVAIVVGLVACVAAFAGAREVFGALAATLSGTPRARAAGVIVAIVVAGGLHAGLAVGELHLRRDAAYAAAMQPERTRLVARELATWTAQQVERGVEISDEARAAQQQRLDSEHRTFPFAWLLGAAIFASMIAGAWRARAGDGEVITRRLLGVAAAAAAIAIATVIVLGALL